MIELLHNMLWRDHFLTRVYFHAGEYFANTMKKLQPGQIMPEFRMTLMKRKKAIEEGADFDEGIHEHRLLLPTEEGIMQCATVTFKEINK